MKKVLAVFIMCVVLVGCGEKEVTEDKEATRLVKMSQYDYLRWDNALCFFNNNQRNLEKIIEEYEATHTNCDYCDKEFLTADLLRLGRNCVQFSRGIWQPTYKHICPSCKSDLKEDYESITEKPEGVCACGREIGLMIGMDTSGNKIPAKKCGHCLAGNSDITSNALIADADSAFNLEPEFVGEVRLPANIYTKKVKVKKVGDEIVITLNKKENKK